MDTRETMKSLLTQLDKHPEFPLVQFKGYDVDYQKDGWEPECSGLQFYLSDTRMEEDYFDEPEFTHDLRKAIEEKLKGLGVTSIARHKRRGVVTYSPRKPKVGELVASVEQVDSGRVWAEVHVKRDKRKRVE